MCPTPCLYNAWFSSPCSEPVGLSSISCLPGLGMHHHLAWRRQISHRQISLSTPWETWEENLGMRTHDPPLSSPPLQPPHTALPHHVSVTHSLLLRAMSQFLSHSHVPVPFSQPCPNSLLSPAHSPRNGSTSLSQTNIYCKS